MSRPADAPSRLADPRELFDLSGRVALVTGGTRGLGLAIARGFAARRRRIVIVVSRKPDACEEVAAALRAEGAKRRGFACHVGHWEELDALVEDVYREFGRIDVLVNNAGISPLYEQLTDVTEELWDKVIGGQPQGPVPPARARRRADGGRPAAARSSTSAAPARSGRRATSSPTPPPRPA